MLIIALAYLYVIGIVAVVSMAGGHLISGLFTLIFGGVLPTVLWLAVLRSKRLNAQSRAQEEAANTSARDASNSSGTFFSADTLSGDFSDDTTDAADTADNNCDAGSASDAGGSCDSNSD